MRTLRLLDPQQKRVLVRVDYNVPIERGRVVDDNRISENLDTLRYLISHQARVILCSHLGRPDGKQDPDPALRLDPVVKRLRELMDSRGLDTPVRKSNEIVGPAVQQLVEATGPGDILVLENIRFDPREEQNDPQFSEELAQLADAFVDDAFGAIHRAHASTVGVTKHLPSYAGLLVEREVKHLEKLTRDPAHPFVMILGGAKPDDKLPLILNLAAKVDFFLLGGGVANTLLQVKGTNIKRTLVGDDKSLAVGRKLLSAFGKKILLPEDFIWEGDSIMDIGPVTRQVFENHITHAKTIFWNGNLGKSEEHRFAQGTRAVAKAIAASRTFSVIGGGDTVAAIDQYRLRKHISFVSTGGGATLEFLAGKSLPGLEVLGYDRND